MMAIKVTTQCPRETFKVVRLGPSDSNRQCSFISALGFDNVQRDHAKARNFVYS